MAKCISRVGTKVSIILDNGQVQHFNYNELKNLILAGRIQVDNMHISESGRLCMNTKGNIMNKYDMSCNSASHNSRHTGMHAGGDKKPFGYYDKYGK